MVLPKLNERTPGGMPDSAGTSPGPAVGLPKMGPGPGPTAQGVPDPDRLVELFTSYTSGQMDRNELIMELAALSQGEGGILGLLETMDETPDQQAPQAGIQPTGAGPDLPGGAPKPLEPIPQLTEPLDKRHQRISLLLQEYGLSPEDADQMSTELNQNPLDIKDLPGYRGGYTINPLDHPRSGDPSTMNMPFVTKGGVIREYIPDQSKNTAGELINLTIGDTSIGTSAGSWDEAAKAAESLGFNPEDIKAALHAQGGDTPKVFGSSQTTPVWDFEEEDDRPRSELLALIGKDEPRTVWSGGKQVTNPLAIQLIREAESQGYKQEDYQGNMRNAVRAYIAAGRGKAKVGPVPEPVSTTSVPTGNKGGGETEETKTVVNPNPISASPGFSQPLVASSGVDYSSFFIPENLSAAGAPAMDKGTGDANLTPTQIDALPDIFMEEDGATLSGREAYETYGSSVFKKEDIQSVQTTGALPKVVSSGYTFAPGYTGRNQAEETQEIIDPNQAPGDLQDRIISNEWPEDGTDQEKKNWLIKNKQSAGGIGNRATVHQFNTRWLESQGGGTREENLHESFFSDAHDIAVLSKERDPETGNQLWFWSRADADRFDAWVKGGNFEARSKTDINQAEEDVTFTQAEMFIRQSQAFGKYFSPDWAPDEAEMGMNAKEAFVRKFVAAKVADWQKYYKDNKEALFDLDAVDEGGSVIAAMEMWMDEGKNLYESHKSAYDEKNKPKPIPPVKDPTLIDLKGGSTTGGVDFSDFPFLKDLLGSLTDQAVSSEVLASSVVQAVADIEKMRSAEHINAANNIMQETVAQLQQDAETARQDANNKLAEGVALGQIGEELTLAAQKEAAANALAAYQMTGKVPQIDPATGQFIVDPETGAIVGDPQDTVEAGRLALSVEELAQDRELRMTELFGRILKTDEDGKVVPGQETLEYQKFGHTKMLQDAEVRGKIINYLPGTTTQDPSEPYVDTFEARRWAWEKDHATRLADNEQARIEVDMAVANLNADLARSEQNLASNIEAGKLSEAVASRRQKMLLEQEKELRERDQMRINALVSLSDPATMVFAQRYGLIQGFEQALGITFGDDLLDPPTFLAPGSMPTAMELSKVGPVERRIMLAEFASQHDMDLDAALAKIQEHTPGSGRITRPSILGVSR